jgi:outer membrane protein assembly factor BamB
MNNLAILLVLTLLWAFPADKTKIYEWRGNGRTGIYPESNLLKSWPAEGPKEIMTIENIGNGFVSPIFTDNSFFITGEVDSVSYLYCFNLKGEKQWQTKLGREWMKTFPGARCAATIAGNLVYVGTGMGDLYCVKRENGQLVWSKDLLKDFGATPPLHGYSEAPLIVGEKIFWTPGGKEFNVVALDRNTGKVIWFNKGFGEKSAYNPPKLIELPSRKIIVTFSSYHMMGFDIQTGKLLWSHEQDNFPLDKRIPGNGDTHSNTVIYEDGFIYYAEGDGNCGAKLKLSADGTTLTEVWRNKGFDSYMGGLVKIGNWLYCGGTVKPQVVAIDATTGVLTDSLRIGSGAIIAADNMLYYYSQKGELNLLSFNQGKIQKVSSFKITKGAKEHFAHPVINNGILYQRHGTFLMAYDIRKK